MLLNQGWNEDTTRQRVRKASRWQDHARLVFEALHTTALARNTRLLARAYKAQVNRNPSSLIRWGYAYATIETYTIVSNTVRSREAIDLRDFWTHQQVFDELRKIVNDAPNEAMGYLGLALAYGRRMFDDQIAAYWQRVGEETVEVIRGGKKERENILVYTNPERWRRFRQNWTKLRSLEPNNPYLSSWQAYDIRHFIVLGKVIEPHSLVYDFNKLKSLSQQDLAEEGYRLVRKAYEDGFKFFSPVIALGDMVYFAWLANRRAEAQRWGEQLREWITQNSNSPYVEYLQIRYASECDLIREFTRQ